METMISNNKSFFAWAKQTCTNHLEILEHMRKSTDPMDRVIAKRIMQTAGLKNSD